MKDYRQIEGMIKQMDECLHHAYDRGYKQGAEKDTAFEGYKQGLLEAWECAKKILNMDEPTIDDVFGEKVMLYKQIFEKYSASEVIYKIKKYEAEKEKRCSEIQVGDEVYFDDKGRKAVVTRVMDDNDLYNILFYNGDTNCVGRKFLAKTGRHYNGIENILYEMKGENE